MTQEEAEFVGFFMSEGCLTVRKTIYHTKIGIREIYMPRIIISLRLDDLPLLKWIQKNFGGMLYYNKAWTQRREIFVRGKKFIQNPTACWTSQSQKDCEKIISLLEQSKMPSQKLKQVLLFKKLLSIKSGRKRQNYGRGLKWYTDEQLAEIDKVKLQLSSSKIFRV